MTTAKVYQDSGSRQEAMPCNLRLTRVCTTYEQITEIVHDSRKVGMQQSKMVRTTAWKSSLRILPRLLVPATSGKQLQFQPCRLHSTHQCYDTRQPVGKMVQLSIKSMEGEKYHCTLLTILITDCKVVLESTARQPPHSLLYLLHILRAPCLPSTSQNCAT